MKHRPGLPAVRGDNQHRAGEEFFSYGIKLLPGPKRKAMSALYAMARRIDDVGDGDAPVPDKLEALAGIRKDPWLTSRARVCRPEPTIPFWWPSLT